MGKDKGVEAMYYGETGDSAYHRMSEHITDIKNNDPSNAFAKHLQLYHPSDIKDTTAFAMKSEKTFKKCLERQVAEGVAISHSKSDILLNSKAEFHQPALNRVTMTREPSTRSRGS